MTRLWLALLLVLALAGCAGPATVHHRPRPHPTPTPTPTPTASPTSPSPAGQLRVVHTPGILVDDMHLVPGQCHARGTTATTVLPDPACTPGAIDPAVTQADIHTTICVRGWTATIRPPLAVTGPAKRAALADYGITVSTTEYDHLVPLELGGASSTSNLWPEIGGIPNPKDGVENQLRAEVCAGSLTLAAAQHEIATDWTSAH